MTKKYIVSVGYNDLLVPTQEIALSILESINVKDIIDGDRRIYIPDRRDLTLKVVDTSEVFDHDPRKVKEDE